MPGSVGGASAGTSSSAGRRRGRPSVNERPRLRGGMEQDARISDALVERLAPIVAHEAYDLGMSAETCARICHAISTRARALDLSEVALPRLPAWLRDSGIERLELRPSARFELNQSAMGALGHLRLTGADVRSISVVYQGDLQQSTKLDSLEIVDVEMLEEIDLATLRVSVMRITGAPRLFSIAHPHGGLSHVDLEALPSLFKLDLSNNDLTTDAVNVGPGTMAALPALVRIDLSHNGLLEVPPALRFSRRLCVVYLEHNRIRELGPLVEAPELMVLDVSYNALLELPENLRSRATLVEYRAAGNLIGSLNADIAQYAALTRLDVSSNCLTALPDELALLAELRSLGIERNPILMYPPVLARMPWLDPSPLQALRYAQEAEAEMGAAGHEGDAGDAAI